MQQKLELEEHCILSKLRYSFSVTPYSPTQLNTLELLRSRLLKDILSLDRSTYSDLLYLPHTHLGCQFRSLIPTYVQMAGQSLATSLADKGRLGTIARALSVTHVRRARTKDNSPSLAHPKLCWMQSRPYAMCLRRAAWISAHGMQVSTPLASYSLAAESADLKEISEDCIRLSALRVTPQDLHDQILIPLWRLGIHHLQQIITHTAPDDQQIIDWEHFCTLWPHADLTSQRALHLLTRMLCGPRSDGAAFLHLNTSEPTQRLIPSLFRIPRPHLAPLDTDNPPMTSPPLPRARQHPSLAGAHPLRARATPGPSETPTSHTRLAPSMSSLEVEKLAHIIQIESVAPAPTPTQRIFCAQSPGATPAAFKLLTELSCSDSDFNPTLNTI